jgi:hypothetical protein
MGTVLFLPFDYQARIARGWWRLTALTSTEGAGSTVLQASRKLNLLSR